MAIIIDGKALSLSLKEQMRDNMPELEARYGRVPCLAVIIVGSNPASQSYVRGKIKAAQFVGMASRLEELPENISEGDLLQKIEILNADSGIDGILVQLPLPAHINKDRIIDAIDIAKDVDGFHPQNTAALWLGRPCTVPCTPRGILKMMDSYGIGLDGKRAVVVGRSDIVGKPVAKLLLDRGATVTIAHSHTEDLTGVCSEADILVAAAGHPGIIKAEMVKEGAAVIDVGITRTEDGHIAGDVDFAAVSAKASYITPVPGGVGPMTITMLLENTVECFKKAMNP